MQLLSFSYSAFNLPTKKKDRKESLATVVKRNVTNPNPDFEPAHSGQPSSNSDESAEITLKRRVEGKMHDGDVKGAIRILSSDDAVAPISPEVLEILRSKHPKAEHDLTIPQVDEAIVLLAEVTDQEVIAAIKSFPKGSAGGIDGLRPQHLKDLIGGLKDESSNRLIKALTSLMTLLLKGDVPSDICPILYGATLTALKKKCGGIRPIAVGNTLRRMAGKIVSRRVMDAMGNMLRPKQLGFGTRGGAEAAVHATRSFISSEPDDCQVLLKLDFFNAFNSIRRDEMLTVVRRYLPDYYSFIWQMYGKPSLLFFGEHQLRSESGVQQADPLGPLLFCLVIKSLTEKLQSELNLWYVDDGTIGGDPRTAKDDLRTVVEEGARIGLKLNL